MSRVYILNKGPHDYSDAEYFGELVYCTEGSLPRDDTAQMYREMLPHIDESEPDDYIMLTSLASLCAVAAAMFAAKHGRLNLLIHKGDGYINKTLHFDTVLSGNR